MPKYSRWQMNILAQIRNQKVLYNVGLTSTLFTLNYKNDKFKKAVNTD